VNRILSIVAASLLVAAPALACSVCFGNADSPQVKSVEMGVWFLLAVVFAVQAGFAGFAYYLFKRSRELQRRAAARPMLRLVKSARGA
jgi:hypothetical protein